jgi:hypothetical protein
VAGTRSALIIASDDYTDPGLRRLRAPVSDAQALGAVLRDPAIGGFEVRTLLNAPAHEVNLAVEEFFADRLPDDVLLLHFSCHGVKDEAGELHFATANTQLRRLGATAVAADFVNRRMTRSRSRRVVLLLDCCYAGAFERGMTPRAGTEVGIEAQFGGRGRAVITASNAMEYAFEGDELADTRASQPSVFTSALVKGLTTGDADRDQDGLVALDELYDYVYDTVRETTPNQTPCKWTFGVQGELVIARRASPVTTPAPLPPELVQAIDHSLASVRTAGVHELERLLRGGHAGLAVAARLSLERLVDDDSRTVAAAASAALGARAEPAPPQTAPLDPTTSQVAPTKPAAPRPEVSSTRPGAVPAPAKRDQHPSEPGKPRPSPSPVPAPAGAPTAPPAAVDHGVALPAAQYERLVRAAGTLAVVSSVLAVVAMFLPWNGEFSQSQRPVLATGIALGAALGAGAGICLFAPPTRRLIGPGLLLGVAVGAPAGVLYDLILGPVYGSLGAGYWLGLLAKVILIVAVCIAGLAVVRVGDVRVGPLPPRDVLAWLVILLGAAGAVTLFSQTYGAAFLPFRDKAFDSAQDLVPLIWTSATALVVPAVAAVAVPRRFGVAVLAGLIAYAMPLPADNIAWPGGPFGYTLLALLIVTILFARTTPTTQVERASAPTGD